LNEKIKRKALLYVSFSLDFLERGTFTEYPSVVFHHLLQISFLNAVVKVSNINVHNENDKK